MKSPFANWTRVDHLPNDQSIDHIPDRMWPFIWFFVRQAKWPFLALTVVWAGSHALESLGPYFIKLIVDAFQSVENPSEIWAVLMPIIPAFVALYLIGQPVLARIGQAILADTRPAFINMVRRQLSLYMYGHYYRYFQNDFAGRIASKVVETPHAVMEVLQTLITSLGYAIVSFLVALWMFSVADSVFVWITMAWLVVYTALMFIFIPKVLARSKVNADNLSLIRGRYVDSLTNILTVKLFARKQHEDKYYLESLEKTTASGRKVWHTINHMQIWLEVITVGYMAATFYSSIIFWQNGTITVGDVAMVLPLMLRLMNVSWWISDTLTHLFEQLGQIQEGMETIFSTKTDKEPSEAKQLKVKQASVQMQDVKFSYDNRSIFESLSLDIPAGQKVGLVGRSGAGKTTITQILLRLFDIQSGRILIDGQDIMGVTKQSLRENIAIIPQHTDMLHRSIMDNILYGDINATEEDVIAAAKKAHAHDFILDLVDHEGNRGYQAKAGERGVKLSGGQRQRIAIARAILKDAPILILDEATSALDSESEKSIQDSLKTLMAGKTVIAIAHRLSTISHLDRLIVMDQGRIVEDGTHESLLKKGGTYAKLWGMQSGGFIGDS